MQQVRPIKLQFLFSWKPVLCLILNYVRRRCLEKAQNYLLVKGKEFFSWWKVSISLRATFCGERQETYLPNFRLKIGHLETSTTETYHILIFFEILARTLSSAFLSNRAQLSKGRLALNPGFFFFCSKAFSWTTFSVKFKSIQSELADKLDFLSLISDPVLS